MDMPPLPIIPGVEFRHLPGYPGYAAADDGTIWSCRSRAGEGKYAPDWRRLVETMIGRRAKTYLSVNLVRNGKARRRYVHGLILEAFVGPRPKGMQACHDPDPHPTNNRLDNLRWDTPAGNNADKIAHGTHQAGEKNGRSKLNDEAVRSIRERHQGGETIAVLAGEHGVSTTLIRYVVTGKNWTHV